MKSILYQRLILPVIFGLGLFIIQPVMAQSIERQVVSSSGATLTQGGFTLDFTLGEMMTTTLEQGDELCQGFQQVWAVVTAIGDWPAEMDIKVYPNPVIDILHVEVAANTNFQLIDLEGHVLMNQSIEAGEETLNVNGLSAGTYFIRFLDVVNRKERTFKMIKLE